MHRALVTLAVLALGCSSPPKRDLAETLSEPHPIELQGHRGARGLAVENTLPAFERALEIGVHTLELDLQRAADGTLVVHHDRALNPLLTRDSTGAYLEAPTPTIASLDVATLATYDLSKPRPDTDYTRRFPEIASSESPVRIPRLDEVFALAETRSRKRIQYNIETKLDPSASDESAASFGRQVHAAIVSAGVTKRATIQSFDWRSLRAARALSPSVTLVCLTETSTVSPAMIEEMKAVGCSIWSPNHDALTFEAVAAVKYESLRVIPWTVNEPADFERLFAIAIDGVITDYPDRARVAFEARLKPLPPRFTR